jgi:hypothetical protein
MSANIAIAQTISEQIGHRAFFLMGTRHKMADGPALLFDLRGSRTVNKIRVRLDPSDTYTVTFWKIRGMTCNTVAEFSGVYADGLNQLIESQTGLALSLGRTESEVA